MLSKSLFKTGCECPRKLLYARNKSYENIKSKDEFLKYLADGGFQVGELAKLYFPGGFDIKALDYDNSISQTKKLLSFPEVIIYEAAIQYKNFFARVDILEKKNKILFLTEVKAKSFSGDFDDFYTKNGKRIKSSWKPYLYDIAFQTFVAKKAYPDHKIKPYLLLVDKTKVATIDGLNQMFRIQRNEKEGRAQAVFTGKIGQTVIGDEILTRVNVEPLVDHILDGNDLPSFAKNKSFEDFAQYLADTYLKNKDITPPVGSHCKNCEFVSTDPLSGKKDGRKLCFAKKFKIKDSSWSNGRPTIFNLWNYRKSDPIIKSGNIFLDQIPDERLFDDLDNLTHTQQRQLLQLNMTKDPSLKEEVSDKLQAEFSKFKYPLNFIDFETCMTALPFTREAPYSPIAFQFSVHQIDANNTVEHHEWLAKADDGFPNFTFIEQLYLTLSSNEGSIFRYAEHENTILQSIKSQLSLAQDENHCYHQYLASLKVSVDTLISFIDEITIRKEITNDGKIVKVAGPRNMFDLCKIVKDHYYHRDMNGSNSIKYVFPSILKEIQEPIYQDLSNLSYGTHLKGRDLYVKSSDGQVLNPYLLLNEDCPERTDDITLAIQNGAMAMKAYNILQYVDISETERASIRQNLLSYCEMDTLAMIIIFRYLFSA